MVAPLEVKGVPELVCERIAPVAVVLRGAAKYELDTKVCEDFTITEKAPTRAFSFTFKTLRHKTQC